LLNICRSITASWSAKGWLKFHIRFTNCNCSGLCVMDLPNWK
jgi:hypothetical protein